MSVRPKKFLGQHFLANKGIAHRIVEALEVEAGSEVLEIGPGTGVLTGFLLDREFRLKVVEIDRDSIAYLESNFLKLKGSIIEGDILKLDLNKIYGTSSFNIIGNLPYNISSQIFFKILDMREKIDQVVCMIQKEVAQRITEPPGSKKYGILSVLLQSYFEMEYLFSVKPGSFIPPPKVDSAVIRMKRNQTKKLDCDEKLFFQVVKQGFQNRRKTLRNALKPINLPDSIKEDPLLNKRAEVLGVEDYVYLTKKIEWERNQ